MYKNNTPEMDAWLKPYNDCLAWVKPWIYATVLLLQNIPKYVENLHVLSKSIVY
jgi:hypothetical protein